MDIGRETIVAVTGAGGGIGYFTAKAFAQRGARVVIGDIDPQRLAAAQNTLSFYGYDIHGMQADVSKADDNVAFARLTCDLAEGRSIILVNNAGILVHGPLNEMPISDATASFQINFFGAMSNVTAFVPMMREKGAGHIVNIASVMAFVTAPDVGIYAASKHAMHAYTQTLRLELAPLGIGVSGIYPGAVTTEIIQHMRRVGPSANADPVVHSAFNKRAITTPDKVAERVVRAVERNSGTVLVGRDAVIGAAMARISPRLATKITAWMTRLG